MGSHEERARIAVEGPRRGPASRAPLFDRLFDYEPRQTEEAQPRRILRRAQVLESIETELLRLLNTRCADTIDRLPERERTVVNYGLPDFLTLSPTSDRDRDRLAGLIRDAIRAYEPRLRNAAVTATPYPGQPGTLLIRVDATLGLGTLAEPVSFPLVIRDRGGAIAAGSLSADRPEG